VQCVACNVISFVKKRSSVLNNTRNVIWASAVNCTLQLSKHVFTGSALLSAVRCRTSTDISDYRDAAIFVVVIIICPDEDPLKPGILVPDYTATHVA